MTELNEISAPRIAAMSTAEFLSATEAHEVPFAAIKDFAGFLNDPQAVSNRTYLEFRDPEYGRIRSLNFFASFNGYATRPKRPGTANRRAY